MGGTGGKLLTEKRTNDSFDDQCDDISLTEVSIIRFTVGGEIAFGLDAAHPERKGVIYPALVTEAVYLGVLACLN